MDVVDAAWAVRRRWRLIAAVVVLGVVTTWVVGIGRPASASASAVYTLALSPSAAADSPVPDAASRSNLDSVVALVRDPVVVERVARQLEFSGDPARLADSVQASADADAGTLSITFSQGRRPNGTLTLDRVSPGSSVETVVATTFGRQLVAYLEERQRDRRRQELEAADRRLDALQTTLRQLDARPASGQPSLPEDVRRAQREAVVRLYSAAYERRDEVASQPLPTAGLAALAVRGPEDPTGSDFTIGRNIHLVAAAGLSAFLAALYVLVSESRRPRIRTARAAERAYRLPVLAEIPPFDSDNGGGVATDPGALAGYRELRTSLGAHLNGGNGVGSPRDGGHVVLVTSACGGEGTTSTVANLAATLAEAGREVLLVDCDLERPRLHELVGVPEGPGLTDALRKGRPVAPLVVATALAGVRLIRAGRPVDDPSTLLSTRFEQLSEVGRLAPIVLIDAPPLLSGSEAFELAPLADMVLVVCRDGDTDAFTAQRAAEKLRRLRTDGSGVVITHATEPGGILGGDGDGPGLAGTFRTLFRDQRPRGEVSAGPEEPRTAPRGITEAVELTRRLARVGRGWTLTVVVTLLAFFLVRTFAVESFAIPTSSMAPTLEPGDRILVTKLGDRFSRGDVVVFDRPEGFAADPRVTSLVKRIVAVGGESVQANGGRVAVNGQPLQEPYLPAGATTADFARRDVPPDHVWVMGDNRADSADSRVYGPVATSAIKGRAFVQVWPPLSVDLM